MTKSGFQTGNVPLITTLALAGVPWFNDEEPIQAEYSPDYLASVGCRTVKEARAKNKPGNFWATFKQGAELDNCIKAFDEAREEFKTFETSGVMRFLEEMKPEERARIIALVLLFRKAILDAPLQCNAWLRFPSEGEPETFRDERGTVVRSPGAKIVRMNATDAVKRKLGLIE